MSLYLYPPSAYVYNTLLLVLLCTYVIYIPVPAVSIVASLVATLFSSKVV